MERPDALTLTHGQQFGPVVVEHANQCLTVVLIDLFGEVTRYPVIGYLTQISSREISTAGHSTLQERNDTKLEDVYGRSSSVGYNSPSAYLTY